MSASTRPTRPSLPAVGATPGNDPSPSLRWILLAKGIGIALVVLGHFQPDIAPAWWTEKIRIVYTFHMPLFMLLSGYLYVHGKQSWGALAAGKSRRLVIPFISIALIFLAIKLAADQVAELRHPITPQAILNLLIDPANSFMPLLWFMHALFLMFVSYPLLRSVLRYNGLILIALVLINTVWSSDYPGLNRVLAHYPFFVMGIWLQEAALLPAMARAAMRASDHAARSTQWAKLAALFAAGFAICVLLIPEQPIQTPHGYPLRLLLGLLGALAVVAVSHWLDTRDNAPVRALATLGFYSMTIYLMHTLFESGVQVAAFQWVGLSLNWFLPVALLAIGAGLVLPLLLEKYVLRRFTLTRSLILGLGQIAGRRQ